MNFGSISQSSKTQTKSVVSLSSAHEENRSYTCRAVVQRSEDYQFALKLQKEEDNKETNTPGYSNMPVCTFMCPQFDF